MEKSIFFKKNYLNHQEFYNIYFNYNKYRRGSETGITDKQGNSLKIGDVVKDESRNASKVRVLLQDDNGELLLYNFYCKDENIFDNGEFYMSPILKLKNGTSAYTRIGEFSEYQVGDFVHQCQYVYSCEGGSKAFNTSNSAKNYLELRFSEYGVVKSFIVKIDDLSFFKPENFQPLINLLTGMQRISTESKVTQIKDIKGFERTQYPSIMNKLISNK